MKKQIFIIILFMIAYALIIFGLYWLIFILGSEYILKPILDMFN